MIKLDEGIVYTISDYGQNMTGHTPTGGCSRESSAMGESLTERRYVNEEALRGVKFFYLGGRRARL
ncbi:MAG: hypothetical protein A3G45_01005 [Candidatus Staskawiczbacteria bacterium RIFCSPLOWO2_12_FULL_37_15]|uniref:Uncharacterized protein n=1 Tax=Candidatus Staskawiczbacteria bacterium RIFCSPLOWO2_12_FULL_37_15 TaxID=1802218 RepID=A0A1G2IKE8_9BACT|nr:MAG: hypothetical protein A3G45_01005 [Candidatus Staskawiczbacteria bacterium RIFCSPLOWO2_12_FULL_37_15]